MHYKTIPLKARFLFEGQDAELCRRVFRFRKTHFVDRLGWTLNVEDGMERDAFDTPGTVHCALMAGDEVAGTFRLIRCDHIIMARALYQVLAERPYPCNADSWEISRFGISPDHAHLAPFLYGLLFHFTVSRGVKTLLGVMERAHERALQKIGLDVRRFGSPQAIGTDAQGFEIVCAAVEIPATEQDFSRLQNLLRLTNHLEITDDTFVFRSGRLSA